MKNDGKDQQDAAPWPKVSHEKYSDAKFVKDTYHLDNIELSYGASSEMIFY